MVRVIGGLRLAFRAWSQVLLRHKRRRRPDAARIDATHALGLFQAVRCCCGCHGDGCTHACVLTYNAFHCGTCRYCAVTDTIVCYGHVFVDLRRKFSDLEDAAWTMCDFANSPNPASTTAGEGSMGNSSSTADGNGGHGNKVEEGDSTHVHQRRRESSGAGRDCIHCVCRELSDGVVKRGRGQRAGCPATE